ncbi:tigger transposable element-derived protein 1-like [Parasteatoda tepidariorum]|uniref:tigger transposable element-derived protein 1-like n=1 Tax=Parasteatoda tepidariorum TaxID=114398 RepID=UPI0039BC5A74
MHGESSSADKDAAEKYCLKFQEFIETEGYRPQQIFNCDETGLFWKCMPKRTYIMKDEKSVPGHKPTKDRLTLLLGANASGDMQLKPLLVIKDYLDTNDLPLKALLLLDNAPGHPKDLKDNLLTDFPWLTVIFTSEYGFVDSADGSGGNCGFREIVHSRAVLKQVNSPQQ